MAVDRSTRQRQNPRYQKPAGCSGCSLERLGFGFAVPSGPLGARLTFIGESLGWEEAIAGEPFYGGAGGVLSRICARAGIDRSQVRIHNIVSCQPPGDYLVGAPWEDHAISQCQQYLRPVLASVPNGGVVVPLGASALTTILGLRGADGIRVQDFHGTVSRIDRGDGTGYWVVPSFHPSHLQRGAMNLLEIVCHDLRRADEISQRGFTRQPANLVIDPHPDWFAKWCQDHVARVSADPEGVHLSIDTEFAEKAGGADESEIIVDTSSGAPASPITRVNGGHDALTGWTVPYRTPYREWADYLLNGVQVAGGWIWAWNKYADIEHLRAAGHRIDNTCWVDGMWLWHYLQSDVLRGLGFVAPMASDFGAWKHWGKIREREGEYAAADGLQNWRTNMWLLASASRTGVWDLFLRDWHERDCYVLRPAHDLGVPVNRSELERFHAELQSKLASVLVRIKETAAQGVLKPKVGYSKKPKGQRCPGCASSPIAGTVFIKQTIDDGMGTETMCESCQGTGELPPTPPKTILGTPKKGGGEAKSAYMLEGVRLVEREVECEITVCDTCHARAVGPRHRCPTKRAVRTKRHGDTSTAGNLGLPESPVAAPAPSLRRTTATATRYFWQLPFNPDAPQQVLAYLDAQGIEAPVDKKRKSRTTNKKALGELAKQHRDDPFFQLQLDWKAVQKVDATYAVGSLNRLDADDRLHPEFLPKPSTFRDSCQNPNLQNVVADKAGPDGLASGFRRCVEARDGVPAGVSAEALEQWRQRWT